MTCQWCPQEFWLTRELKIHAKKHHREEYATQETERDIEEKEDPKSTDVSEAENQHPEFLREKYPAKEDNDDGDNNEFQGITLKSNSRIYIHAYNKLKKTDDK